MVWHENYSNDPNFGKQIQAIRAFDIKPGYVTDHGLCVSAAKFPPYVMCQFYKDEGTISQMLSFSDRVLIYVED